jgi:phosphoribosylaminoimidazolecarboxamide formyltransferase / IMP cyclohydrolase
VGMSAVVVRRALISVYDKEGLVDFATRLHRAGVEIVSSGGTAAALSAAGLPVITVEELTGSAEILGGRVKTLHPKIHGAILARLDTPEDRAELEANGIEPFQLVVVSLYPFAATVATPGATVSDIIEKIDIGGPTMIRAAAKNHAYVGVVTSPAQYERVAAAVESGGLDDQLRRELAAEAFFHTASYDGDIVEWFGPDRVLSLRHVGGLRYGENPHQAADVYAESGADPWWSKAVLRQGKEMSFNNYADAEAAWRLANTLPGCVAIIKHTNACGAAVGEIVADTFERAWACDPLSAFGGVVAINGVLDGETAAALRDRFVEVVICAGATESALAVLSDKPALRVLEAPPPGGGDPDLRRIESGFLIQDRDRIGDAEWSVVSERAPDATEMSELRFAWTVAMSTKSNAVVIVRDSAAVGVGAGDQSRVGAAERAVARAADRAAGGVAASDAFFPFRDGLDVLAAAGVTAVVEPGGSRNDPELIAAADEHGIALVFTGERHFRH